MSDIQTAIKNGVTWLASKQNLDGSWGSGAYPIGDTGLVLIKLESYALEQGLSPFDDAYEYKNNVVSGLNFLFNKAQQDINGVYFEESGRINYQTGIVLAALCANGEPTRIVNTGILTGQTYKQVAQSMVNYLAYSQQDSGPNIGGWAYEKGDTPDNSVSGYVVLGLEFAIAPAYQFGCSVPNTTKTNLDSWINYIQSTDGGSGYQVANNWENILKTGNLIEEMHFYGDALITSRVQSAITYIANNWNAPVATFAGGLEPGWRDINNSNVTIDYQATFTTMKGLTDYDISIITTTGGVNIDWFNDMSQAILAQQNPDGSWPRSIWDTFDNDTILSTTWALLTLEKVVKVPAEIPFIDTIVVSEKNVRCPWNIEQIIEIQGEVKIFAKKYSHLETECTPNIKASKGDDIGFTLVYGNYGEFYYEAPSGKPTVEDKLYIQSPVYLKLMSLCIAENTQLYNVTNKKVVEVCDVFYGGIEYDLQVQKYDSSSESWIADFNIGCHSICCISMLFQIEFPACPACPNETP